MKRLLVFPALILVSALVLSASSTSGAHFMSSSSEVNGVGQLSVSFNEAGLGNGDITYTVTANAIYDWGCINGGGNHPQASNKDTSSTPVAGGDTFQSKNGRVSGTILAPHDPPAPPTDFSCPGGMTLVLADASYTDIVLTDTNNSVSIDLPDASAIYFQFKKH